MFFEEIISKTPFLSLTNNGIISTSLFVFSIKVSKLSLEEKKENVLSFDGITINKDEYFVEIDGKEITLPRKEFELLSLLASVPNKVFNREIILKTVWGQDVVVGGRTIDVHIRKLREKIGDDFIKTIKGVGYKFVD